MKRSSGSYSWRITVHSVRRPNAPLGGEKRSQPGITVHHHHHTGIWTYQYSTKLLETCSNSLPKCLRGEFTERKARQQPARLDQRRLRKTLDLPLLLFGFACFLRLHLGPSAMILSLSLKRSRSRVTSLLLLLLLPHPPPPPHASPLPSLSPVRFTTTPSPSTTAKHLVCDTLDGFTASPSQTPQLMAPPTGRTWVCVLWSQTVVLPPCKGRPGTPTSSAPPDCWEKIKYNSEEFLHMWKYKEYI